MYPHALPYMMPKVPFAGVRHRVPVARIYQVSTFHKRALQQATTARYCEVGDSSSWENKHGFSFIPSSRRVDIAGPFIACVRAKKIGVFDHEFVFLRLPLRYLL